jgi:predicted RND superfamily exporter protein
MVGAPKNQAGFLTLWTALVVTLGFMLLCVAKPEAVIVLGILMWFAVALPYALVVSLARATARTRQPKRTAAKVKKAKEAKSPTKADTIRKARVELEEALAVIAGLAMDEDEKDVLRERAREAYLDKVSPYLT